MQLDIEQIKNLIPQRFPFIMIDKILELEPDNYAISMKNITYNDIFFQGHFPDNPIMPGALIIEAMAQTAIVLFAHSSSSPTNNKHALSSPSFDKKTPNEGIECLPSKIKQPVYYFGSVRARFLHPVVPGDQLRIKVVNVKSLPTGAFVEAEASVDDKKVSEAELVFSVK